MVDRPSDPQRGMLTAADANRLFYQSVARTYDEHEYCVVSERARGVLRHLLGIALEQAGENPLVLDACGGSGHASEMLLEFGVESVLVDISPAMLHRWKEKAAIRGLDPEMHEAEISSFLRGDGRSWDVIVFSSALHHMENYSEIATLAVERLKPGGALVTAFDPVRAGRSLQFLRRVDWVVHRAIHQPLELLSIVLGKFRYWRLSEAPIGRIAERHAGTGIDDVALCDLLSSSGAEIVVHMRQSDARLAALRAVLRAARIPSVFHLIVKRKA
jgi:ubiquinone/menaquinone biosynthesis C-methylase UbiE